MWNMIRARWSQGLKTIAFPPEPAVAGLPARFRGLPVIDPSAPAEAREVAARTCPTGAIAPDPLTLDLGKCVFCGECARLDLAPEQAAPVRFTPEWRLASSSRDDLVLRGAEPRLRCELDAKMRRLFGRSLKLRQVSAAGCNGCEAELVATGNIIFDLGRFGIQFVASPRHADGIVVTGPVSQNMRAALLETWAATPPPKLVIAVGACAIAGGPFFDSPLQHGGAAAALAPVPVDLFIPGCPPHPLTILDGLLRLLGKVESGSPR